MNERTERILTERRLSKKTKLSKNRLPLDPERCNVKRASNARAALKVYRAIAGVDKCDAVCDFIGDLMHLCDRDASLGGFEVGLDRAYRHYKHDTATDAEYARM